MRNKIFGLELACDGVEFEKIHGEIETARFPFANCGECGKRRLGGTYFPDCGSIDFPNKPITAEEFGEIAKNKSSCPVSSGDFFGPTIWYPPLQPTLDAYRPFSLIFILVASQRLKDALSRIAPDSLQWYRINVFCPKLGSIDQSLNYFGLRTSYFACAANPNSCDACNDAFQRRFASVQPFDPNMFEKLKCFQIGGYAHAVVNSETADVLQGMNFSNLRIVELDLAEIVEEFQPKPSWMVGRR